MSNKEEKPFKPYIPPERIQPELSVAAVIMGALLSIVFGAANAYLGLRVGMTVSASIPAAVISMVVMRVILRRKSILESNMVQTIGSAGESLAGGAIFTMPVFFLWSAEGLSDSPNLLTLSILAIAGGVIGVLFMIPMRNTLTVKEHGVLPYPEGTACAKVLLSAEKEGSGSKGIFAGMGIAALFKLLTDGIKVIPSTITAPIRALKTELSAEIYPALIGVFASAVTIGAVLILLNSAWGFGSKQLAAPQATLMKMLVEGVMSGNLPWTLILIGACLAAVIQILGIPVLPVAIGLYLPMELSVTIMIGGIVRWISDRRMKKQGREEGSGILFCSGMIAGEGLVGILLAVFAVAGIDKAIDLSSSLNLGWAGGIALIVLLIAATMWFSKGARKEE